MKYLFLLIGIGSILVIVIAVTASLAFMRFSPDTEVRRMLAVMGDVKTIREEAGWSWVREGDEGRVTTTLFTSGQINLADPTAVEHATRFRVVKIGKGKDYEDLTGEIRSLGGISYLTYEPPGPHMSGVDFRSKDVWVSFASGELSKWGEVIPGLEAPVVGKGSRGSHEPRGPEDEEDGLMKIRTLVSKADVFIASFGGLTEPIRGTVTRVIDARVDPDAVRAFLRDVVRAREGREPTDEERLTVESEALALEKLTFRFWIGISDHRLYRLQAAGAVPEPDSTKLIPADVLIEFSDFDEPFTVGIPTKPTAFQAIVTSHFASLPEADRDPTQSTSSATWDMDARLPITMVTEDADADKDGLDSLLEAFYRTNTSRADTDGDGMNDGDEVREGRNPNGAGSLFGFGGR